MVCTNSRAAADDGSTSTPADTRYADRRNLASRRTTMTSTARVCTPLRASTMIGRRRRRGSGVERQTDFPRNPAPSCVVRGADRVGAGLGFIRHDGQLSHPRRLISRAALTTAPLARAGIARAVGGWPHSYAAGMFPCASTAHQQIDRGLKEHPAKKRPSPTFWPRDRVRHQHRGDPPRPVDVGQRTWRLPGRQHHRQTGPMTATALHVPWSGGLRTGRFTALGAGPGRRATRRGSAARRLRQ
jgi:hypothetical protein